MVVAVQFKKHVSNSCIFYIIIHKLNHWQEPCLVIMLKVDKNLKVHFYCAILMFGLTICLRMKGSWEPLFNVKKVAER